LLSGEADVGHCGFNVPIWNLEIATAAVTGHLPSFLRRVVLVGEAALGLALDEEGVGMSEDTAGRFMNVSKNLAGRIPTVRNSSPPYSTPSLRRARRMRCGGRLWSG
jgi:hypothetical protein